MKFKKGDKVQIIYTHKEEGCPLPFPGSHITKAFVGKIVSGNRDLRDPRYTVIFQNVGTKWEQYLPEENLKFYVSIEEGLYRLNQLIESKELMKT